MPDWPTVSQIRTGLSLQPSFPAYAGERAYYRLDHRALQLLEPGGFLISSSCSMHLSAERLQQFLLQAARDSGRRLQVLERGFQAIDHPVHPAIPEAAYLKTLIRRELPARD
jgi:23S rRNA (cytosine1962-C5)-methyltransferase